MKVTNTVNYVMKKEVNVDINIFPKKDYGLVINLVLQYPNFKTYIFKCYHMDELPELLDFLIALEYE